MSTDVEFEERLSTLLHRAVVELEPDGELVKRVRRRRRRRRAARWTVVSVAVAVAAAVVLTVTPFEGRSEPGRSIRLAAYTVELPPSLSATPTTGAGPCSSRRLSGGWFRVGDTPDMVSDGGAVLARDTGLTFITPHDPARSANLVEATPAYGKPPFDLAISEYVVASHGGTGCVWSFLTSAYQAPSAGDPLVPAAAQSVRIGSYAAWTLATPTAPSPPATSGSGDAQSMVDLYVQIPVAAENADDQTWVVGFSTAVVTRTQALGLVRQALGGPTGQGNQEK